MKQNDMLLKDAGIKKMELEKSISALIRKFTDETGITVSEIKIFNYSKRHSSGIVSTHNAVVEIIAIL